MRTAARSMTACASARSAFVVGRFGSCASSSAPASCRPQPGIRGCRPPKLRQGQIEAGFRFRTRLHRDEKARSPRLAAVHGNDEGVSPPGRVAAALPKSSWLRSLRADASSRAFYGARLENEKRDLEITASPVESSADFIAPRRPTPIPRLGPLPAPRSPGRKSRSPPPMGLHRINPKNPSPPKIPNRQMAD